jgi:hypothetical protein
VLSAKSSRLESVALDLAVLGYHPFPCQPRGKKPLTANGFKDATRDDRQILHWWDRWPDANIGIACGSSGIVVLDIDPKHGADPDEVVAELGLEHHPHTVSTGAAPEPDAMWPDSLGGVRGRHLYFKGNQQSIPKTTIRGVEIRGGGFYVVAPGSAHSSGVPYEGTLPPVSALLDVPDSVFGILERPANGAAVSRAGHHRRRGSPQRAGAGRRSGGPQGRDRR